MFKLFFLILLVDFSSNAKEPTLAILKKIYSNNLQQIIINSYVLKCNAYGITSIEELREENLNNSVCQESINNFYKKNLNTKYFIFNLLKIEEIYHLEFRKNQCILYANGEKTLSEILLENGLALIDTKIDKEFRYSFFKAQKKAKFNKLGIWREQIPKKCFLKITY